MYVLRIWGNYGWVYVTGDGSPIMGIPITTPDIRSARIFDRQETAESYNTNCILDFELLEV